MWHIYKIDRQKNCKVTLIEKKTFTTELLTLFVVVKGRRTKKHNQPLEGVLWAL